MSAPLITALTDAARSEPQLCVSNLDDRRAAWAQWVIDRLNGFTITGSTQRSYNAIILDGEIRRGSRIRPHIELSERALNCPHLPIVERVAAIGNLFAGRIWDADEIITIKRALLDTAAPTGLPAADLHAMVHAARPRIVAHFDVARKAALSRGWEHVDQMVKAGDRDLAALLAKPASRQELTALIPAAAALGVAAGPHPHLVDVSGRWLTRRNHVWTLGDTTLTVLTPRVTIAGLLFGMSTDSDSSPAVLVATILLRRIASDVLGVAIDSMATVEPSATITDTAFFRAVPARHGQATTSASTAAAVRFIRSQPDARRAWSALSAFTASRGIILTVDETTFLSAHVRAARAVFSGENPAAADVNYLLPTGWDAGRRTITVTFSRKPLRDL